LTASKQDQIILSPIGEFSSGLIDPVVRIVSNAFGFDTILTPILQDIEFARDTARNQYHSTPILQRLAAEAPARAIKVAALCRVDLFIPILTYVYGEAQLNGRACIISSYRLDDSLVGAEPEERFVSRMAKETIHELGHTFDLRHCPDPVCLMHYCRNESDVDRKSDQFCRYCKVLLGDALGKL
jgi:archaemetzincin